MPGEYFWITRKVLFPWDMCYESQNSQESFHHLLKFWFRKWVYENSLRLGLIHFIWQCEQCIGNDSMHGPHHSRKERTWTQIHICKSFANEIIYKTGLLGEKNHIMFYGLKCGALIEEHSVCVHIRNLVYLLNMQSLV